MFTLKHTDPINYAYDNTLYVIANSFQEAIQKIVADGNISFDWFTYNDMQVNPSKFHFMVTHSSAILLTLKTLQLNKKTV